MKLLKNGNAVEILLTGKRKYGIIGDEYKARELRLLNDRINAGYLIDNFNGVLC